MADRRRTRFGLGAACVALLGLAVAGGPAVASAASPGAPAGFGDQVVDAYRAEYAAAVTFGQGSALASVSDYAQQVAALTPGELDALYSATVQVPAWSQIPSLMQVVAASAPARAAGSAAGASSARSRVAAAAGAGSAFRPADCSAGPPSSAVFATQLVLDAAWAVFNFVTALGSGGSTNALLVAAVTAPVIAAAGIVHDTLAFLQDDAASCAASNTAGYLASIDDVTAQTFALSTTIAGVITDLQSTADGTADVLSAARANLANLADAGRQIVQDHATIQSGLGGDTAALLAQLDSNRKGLLGDVTTLRRVAKTNAKTLSGAVDGGESAITDSLSSALARILDETDSTAQALGDLLAANGPQLLAALKADRTTVKQQFDENLKLDIEQALASAHPQLRMKLPASVGGYLDAKPVGVQSVVQGDIAALAAASPAAASRATSLTVAAKRALAAHDYFAAFADLQQAYLALTGA